AGEEDAVLPGREGGLALHAAEELHDLLGLARVVPLVVLPEHAPVFHHHGLDRGGADVDADDPHAGRGLTWPPRRCGPVCGRRAGGFWRRSPPRCRRAGSCTSLSSSRGARGDTRGPRPPWAPCARGCRRTPSARASWPR